MLSGFLYPDVPFQLKYHSEFFKVGSVMMMRPLTMMNLSGTAVSEAASFYKLKSDEILVAHDDLELPLGEARIQKGGGLGGHNGLRSIKERIGSDGFWRIRIGIGRPIHDDVSLYVTSPFTADEKITLSRIFPKIREAITEPLRETRLTI